MAMPQTIRDNTENLVRKLAMGILSNVVIATPVDTGKARANWRVSLTNPLTDSIDEKDKSGREAINKGRMIVSVFRLKDVSINITNNLPYINRLNNGWSKQANAGYVERAIEGVQADIRNADLIHRRGKFYAKGGSE
jgi:hypothetical protein